ncbi:GAF domain-containing protein [Bosea sp. BH3]|uniref:GAF domain-containing protein n=1 Tax=Bosea sp. BH3 TaxID=2871701 RepID=UPI0021CB35B3|nr:GAF domain-containing protein [Bosea sp. BH3]MCU4180441.1 GAF domain-containing protein [Bosea sp. BH3]
MSSSKQPITAADIAEVAELVAKAEPKVAYSAIDALVQKVWGHKLLTVLAYRAETVEVERLYSSNETAYPVGGRKPKQGTAWGAHVLEKGEFHISHNAEDIKATFFDHELIASLGASGMINIPLLVSGRCVGTLNISNVAGFFSEADFPTARIFGALTVPLLLNEA